MNYLYIKTINLKLIYNYLNHKFISFSVCTVSQFIVVYRWFCKLGYIQRNEVFLPYKKWNLRENNMQFPLGAGDFIFQLFWWPCTWIGLSPKYMHSLVASLHDVFCSNCSIWSKRTLKDNFLSWLTSGY